ncbi:MAG: response regulator [Pirellulales bacterium]|nr:response regulator [Pirellulales bacterium]
MENTRARILVAEDNPALAAVIEFNLRRAGCAVTRMRNGRLALEAAMEEDFDLVVTDHQMPEMTGIELCERLRALPQYMDTPIIMLTAKGLELDMSNLGETVGVSEYLSKPFSPAELVRKIEECLISSCAITS